MYSNKWVVEEVTYNRGTRGHYQVMRDDSAQRRQTDLQFSLTPDGLAAARVMRDTKNGGLATRKTIE